MLKKIIPIFKLQYKFSAKPIIRTGVNITYLYFPQLSRECQKGHLTKSWSPFEIKKAGSEVKHMISPKSIMSWDDSTLDWYKRTPGPNKANIRSSVFEMRISHVSLDSKG